MEIPAMLFSTGSFPSPNAFSQPVFDALGFGVVVIEADTHRIVYANKKALQMSAQTETGLLGRQCQRLLCPAEVGRCPITDLGQSVDNSERQMLRADGRQLPIIKTVVPVQMEGRRYLLESLVDCSVQKEMQASLQTANDELQLEIDKRSRIEGQLKELAYSDPLTGLPNRLSFLRRLNESLADTCPEEKLAVLFIDLDDFKMVNDTMGHDVGDLLLLEVAERFQSSLRAGDVLARIGGDEFVVLLIDAEPAVLKPVADQLLGNLRNPFKINGREFFVTASIGAAVFPQDGKDADTLIKHADIAMYKAKERGRNQWSLCTMPMKVQVEEWMMLSTELYRAIEREELDLYYQPQVSCESGRIIGMEALVRWEHPQLGLLPPAKFIPIAEQTGLIHSIGKWVLYTACRQNRLWQQAGLPAIPVAVNLSVMQFRKAGIVRQVESILAETGLSPEFLELEITESVAMEDTQTIVERLRALKEKGSRIAIDDFGTEYSSLSYIKQLPVDKIKIAMPFVRGIGLYEKDEAITKSIIVLAQSLGLRVIAEGVETEPQLSFLQDHYCDEVQGYYYYRPMTAARMERLLKASLFGTQDSWR